MRREAVVRRAALGALCAALACVVLVLPLAHWRALDAARPPAGLPAALQPAYDVALRGEAQLFGAQVWRGFARADPVVPRAQLAAAGGSLPALFGLDVSWRAPGDPLIGNRVTLPALDGVSPFAELGDARVVRIEHAWVGMDGTTFNATHYFATDLLYVFREAGAFPAWAGDVRAMPVRVHAALVNCVQLWGDGYYHFLFEALPRLVAAWPVLFEGAAGEPPGTVHVLVPRAARARELLDMLGVPRSRIVLYERGTLYYARRTYLTRHVPVGFTPREALVALRDRFGGARPNNGSTSAPLVVVYAHREAPLPRQLENAEEIVADARQLLDAHVRCRGGPRACQFVRLTGSESSAQTRDVLRRASVLFGPHGAGLANMLFAPPGLAVLEVIPGGEANLCFWHAARALGHQHFALVSPDRRAADALHADRDAFRELFAQALDVGSGGV